MEQMLSGVTMYTCRLQ